MIKSLLDRLLSEMLMPALILSIPVSIAKDFGFHQINLPSEPLMALIALLLIYLIDFQSLYRSPFLNHPISKISILYLAWMLICTLFTSSIQHSFKFVVVTFTHWWVFYVGLGYYLRAKGNLLRVFHWYGFILILVILYSWYHHALVGFRIDASVMTARPFYADHALYGACISFLLFIYLIHFYQSNRVRLKLFYCTIALVLLTGIYFSYSRAVWLSLVITLFLAALAIAFRSRHMILIILAGLLLSSAMVTLTGSVRMTNASGSKKNDILSHIESSFSLSSDVSNLERINRYRSAWRMFKDRPIFGFGPGTFSLVYLPYQKKDEMTRLSVTATRTQEGKPHPSGRGGGAHSEYFQALAELGLVGLFFWLLLVWGAIHTGLRSFQSSNSQDRWIILAITLALITFAIHGMFNNFFHSEEIAILFWLTITSIAHEGLTPMAKSKG